MMKRLIAALLAALCLSALPLTALGANATRVTVTLPYRHVWKTDVPNADDRFTYRWTVETEGAPMPVGKTGTYWDWHLRGNTEGMLKLPFSFSRAGTYCYRLAAYVPKPKKWYVYEPRTFLLTVTVKEAQGGGLRAEWSVLNENSGAKVDIIDLDPSYTFQDKSEVAWLARWNSAWEFAEGGGGNSSSHKKSGSRKKSSSRNGRSARSVKTGDETRIRSMVVILSVSGVLMAYLVYEELRERRAGKK